MKKLINPTTYFFQQAENVPNPYAKQIQQFASKLINFENCQLCKYPYDLTINTPRIMIHCGHTFCTPCLTKFYMNRRVRCPMCLKLVKQIDSIDRLPLNHSIVKKIVQKENQKLQQKIKEYDFNKNDAQRNKKNLNNNGKVKLIDASMLLYSEFQRTQKQALMKQHSPKFDQVSGLPFCVFHPDRVQHFHCLPHKASGCRACIEIGHSKPQCQTIDLYNDNDPRVVQLTLASQSKIPPISYINHNYDIMEADFDPNLMNLMKNNGKADLNSINYGKTHLGSNNFNNPMNNIQITPRMQQYHGENSLSENLSGSLPDTMIQNVQGTYDNYVSVSSNLSGKNQFFQQDHQLPQFGIKTKSELVPNSGSDHNIDYPLNMQQSSNNSFGNTSNGNFTGLNMNLESQTAKKMIKKFQQMRQNKKFKEDQQQEEPQDFDDDDDDDDDDQ